MRLSRVVVAAMAAGSPALAFTNGSLVPAYICDPVMDGLPKSFGELLPYTREMTGPVAFNYNATQNVVAAPYTPTNGSMVGNSAFILSSFHNTLNSLLVMEQGAVVATANGGPIVAGQANQLSLSSGNASIALDGLMLYAKTANVSRVGSFTDQGGMGTFADFPGCGLNQQGQFAGVIQQMVISCNSTYNQLFFNAPACVPGNSLTIAGLSVTDGGFGVWTYNFAVTGSTCGTTKKLRRLTSARS